MIHKFDILICFKKSEKMIIIYMHTENNGKIVYLRYHNVYRK